MVVHWVVHLAFYLAVRSAVRSAEMTELWLAERMAFLWAVTMGFSMVGPLAFPLVVH